MAIDDPNPVLFFEHKCFTAAFQALWLKKITSWNLEWDERFAHGQDATIITYGLGVQWAEQVLDSIPTGT